MAKRLDVTRARAAEITELFFAADGVIAAELKRGGKVAISGFGNFETPQAGGARGAESAHRQGASASRPSMVPAFRAGRALKELVNRKR